MPWHLLLLLVESPRRLESNPLEIFGAAAIAFFMIKADVKKTRKYSFQQEAPGHEKFSRLS